MISSIDQTKGCQPIFSLCEAVSDVHVKKNTNIS